MPRILNIHGHLARVRCHGNVDSPTLFSSLLCQSDVVITTPATLGVIPAIQFLLPSRTESPDLRGIDARRIQADWNLHSERIGNY